MVRNKNSGNINLISKTVDELYYMYKSSKQAKLEQLLFGRLESNGSTKTENRPANFPLGLLLLMARE